MTDPFRLDNETALITGGGTGLGLGIARCLVRQGAKVVLVGRRKAELDSAVGELGASAFAIPADITDVDRAPALLQQAESAAGAAVSLLVNNAGIHLKKPGAQTTPAELTAVLQTHVVAAHALTAAVLPGMTQRRHGVVLFTASMASFFGIPNVMAYAAAKSAYLGIVRTLAVEAADSGVRINAIAPGWIDSAMVRKAMDGDPQRRQKVLSRTPMARFGEADDIGWAAAYLCSPAAKFVTGVILPVDGGISIGF